jgi:hypothetical protein
MPDKRKVEQKRNTTGSKFVPAPPNHWSQLKKQLKSKTNQELKNLCKNGRFNLKKRIALELLYQRTGKVPDSCKNSKMGKILRKKIVLKQLNEATAFDVRELNDNESIDKLKPLNTLLNRFDDFDLLELAEYAQCQAIRDTATELIKERKVREKIESRILYFNSCEVETLRHIIKQEEYYFKIAEKILRQRLQDSFVALSQTELNEICEKYPGTLEAQIATEVIFSRSSRESPAPVTGVDWRNESERRGTA